MPNYKNFQEFSQANDVKFVDFRFTDQKGKWQHLTYNIEAVTETILTEGIFFDGSSIEGWKEVNQSDMILMPDLSDLSLDPFSPYPTIIIFCNIFDPVTLKGYDLDPRHIASLAEQFLQDSQIGDTAFFGPELEFFIFDDVRFKNGNYGSFYEIDANEHPNNSDKKIESGNLGHRPKQKGGYFPVPPLDSGFDIRAEMSLTLRAMGLDAMLHHHEVAPAQHEMGVKFNSLVKAADSVQKYKFVVHNVAASYGKTASFMPKPVFGDNGSGMHVHQSIGKNGRNIFAGNQYGGLSEIALHYIGGIIKHSKALNAITNASTNSYKRLVPGFEAPTILAYSERNRSAAIRIPASKGENAKRIEVRFPDATANPYLAFSAMLLAGLDGIKNKINPGAADERNLYELSEKELKKKPQVASSLEIALNSLDKDRKFLLPAFSDEQIDSYIAIKMKEVQELNLRPHPIEFENYYSC